MKNSILILVAILMMGCATRRDKSIAYMNDNPQDLAALCALHFKPIIEYKPGVTIHKTDTQYVDGDPIPCPPNEAGEVVYVRGRDKIVKDTVWRTDTATVRDVAFERVLSDRVASKNDSLRVALYRAEKAEKRSKTLTWALVGVGVLGVGAFALKLRGII